MSDKQIAMSFHVELLLIITCSTINRSDALSEDLPHVIAFIASCFELFLAQLEVPCCIFGIFASTNDPSSDSFDTTLEDKPRVCRSIRDTQIQDQLFPE